MTKKRIAVFDLDGSLVETDSANSVAYECALARFGVHGVGALYGRITADTIRAAGMADADVNAVVKVKIEAYCHELWRTHLGAAAEALQCVLVNRSEFDKVVLLTNSIERRAIETLRYYGLKRCFDEIVCNGGSGDKYANYFKSFDSDPAACVVWENEEGQIMSAIAAGVKTENIRKVG